MKSIHQKSINSIKKYLKLFKTSFCSNILKQYLKNKASTITDYFSKKIKTIHNNAMHTMHNILHNIPVIHFFNYMLWKSIESI